MICRLIIIVATLLTSSVAQADRARQMAMSMMMQAPVRTQAPALKAVASPTRLSGHLPATYRQITKYKSVQRCNGRRCWTERVPYTEWEKIPAARATNSKAAYYPQRPITWTLNGRWVTRDHLIHHHAHDQDNLDPAWVNSLDSRTVQSVHQDMHNHRLNYSFAQLRP